MRALIAIGHRVRRRMLALLRWRTRGVKAMVFDRAGRVLLVRHHYGATALWMLPGGGIARGEAPMDAARREVREETGCALEEVTAVARFAARAEGRRDTVYLFRATTRDPPVPDGIEIAQAAFFALDDLPPATSPATRRRLEEHQGGRETAANW